MTNIIAFRRPVETGHVTALPNPSFEPAEVFEMTPRERKRLARQQAEPATETARNARLRRQRWQEWENGIAQIRYYRAALDMHNAIDVVQRRGLPEGENHAGRDDTHHDELVKMWRSAIARQFLTPASRLLDVDWKRAALRRGNHRYTGVTEQQISRAIERDVQFLADHPVRKCV